MWCHTLSLSAVLQLLLYRPGRWIAFNARESPPTPKTPLVLVTPVAAEGAEAEGGTDRKSRWKGRNVAPARWLGSELLQYFSPHSTGFERSLALATILLACHPTVTGDWTEQSSRLSVSHMGSRMWGDFTILENSSVCFIQKKTKKNFCSIHDDYDSLRGGKKRIPALIYLYSPLNLMIECIIWSSEKRRRDQTNLISKLKGENRTSQMLMDVTTMGFLRCRLRPKTHVTYESTVTMVMHNTEQGLLCFTGNVLCFADEWTDCSDRSRAVTLSYGRGVSAANFAHRHINGEQKTDVWLELVMCFVFFLWPEQIIEAKRQKWLSSGTIKCIKEPNINWLNDFKLQHSSSGAMKNNLWLN